MALIKDFCKIFDELSIAAAKGNLEEVSNENLTISKRRLLSRLIGNIGVSNKEDWISFEASFDRFVSSLRDKVTPILFEIVLKVGLKLKAENNNQFWFSLITTFDYGVTFDRVEALKILVGEVVKDAENSWKAACLLCILIQDYPNTVNPIKKQLLSVVGDLNKLLFNSSCYTLICYLVELISQLDDQLLTEGFTIGCFTDLPKRCFSNDSKCQKFMQASTTCISSIVTIESFNLGRVVTNKPGVCEITKYSLTALIQTNDYVTPIEINFTDINDLERDGSKLTFTLSNPPKHALVTKVEIPKSSLITILFISNNASQSFIGRLLEECEVSQEEVTPRKISIAETFIKLNSGNYNEQVEEQSDNISENIGMQDTTAEPVQEVPASTDGENSQVITEPSKFTESSGDLLISHVDNTKDTSAFTNRASRSISKIVAESTRDNIFGIKGCIRDSPPQSPPPPPPPPQHTLSTSSFAPDTLDTVFKTIANKNASEDPHLKSSSVPPPELNDSVKEKSNTRGSSADPWGFISDEELQVKTNVKPKSKAMKVFNNFNKKDTPKKTMPNQIYKKATKLNLITADTSKHVNISNQKSPTIQPSSIDQAEASFSGLTSPIIHAQRRASTKLAHSMTRETSVAIGTVNPSLAKNKKEDTKLGHIKKKKRNSNAADLDNDYSPSPEVENEFQKPPKKKSTIKDVVNPALRNKKKQPQANVKTETLAQILKGPRKRRSKKVVANPKLAKTIKPKAVASVEASNVELPEEIISDKNEKSENTRQTSVIESQNAPSKPKQVLGNIPGVSFSMADALLSEAYTNTLQKQIFESITSFSNQLVKKIHIINEEINKKVMNDLTTKYETLFNDLRINFSNDVDEMCDFISDVKSLLNLPEEDLVTYIKSKKLGEKINQANNSS